MVKPTDNQQPVVAHVALARLPRSEAPPGRAGDGAVALAPTEKDAEAVASWLEGLGFSTRLVPGVAITVASDPETFENRFQCKVRMHNGYWEYEREPVLPAPPKHLLLRIIGVFLLVPSARC